MVGLAYQTRHKKHKAVTMKQRMIDYVAKLHSYGCAIHWLHPKSKRPIDAGWTKRERSTMQGLKTKYIVGCNVGVRLGECSAIGPGYLAVIDIDYKHPKATPKQKKEWRKAVSTELRANFPTLNITFCQIVNTGRRNGSSHIYFLTDKPLASRKVAQSKDTVPLELLSNGKYTKSPPCWEIDFMSNGRQTVLPPSVHPETGKTYQYRNEILKDFTKIQLIKSEEIRLNLERSSLSNRGTSESHGGEESLAEASAKIDLGLVAQDTMDRLASEEGDRSAQIFVIAMDLVREGFSDQEIALVLTDRERFPYLGETGFSHASTIKRNVAMNWVQKYTVAKAREEADARASFEDIEVLPALSEKDAREQELELLGVESWREDIDRVKGPDSPPKITLLNVVKILRGEFGPKFVRMNLFSGEQSYGVNVPWGGKKGRGIKNEDLIAIKCWMAGKWRLEPGVDKVNEAITEISRHNAFHPVRDYLASLVWDGKPRINNWLATYMGAIGPEPYLSQVSTKIPVAMVARVMQPGCKFDQMVILEGIQGIGKSTLLRHLAGNAWFSDADIDIQDKDAVVNMRGTWLWEIGELTGMRRADINNLKQFMSRREDKIRMPYGRRSEILPRETVFIGTTNSDEYLADETGNRRFWPVKLTNEYDFEGVKGIRDQLFAEAYWLWELGEPLHLEGVAVNQAMGEQDDRRHQDAIVGDIEKVINDPVNNINGQITVHQLVNVMGVKNDQSHQQRLAKGLKVLGWGKTRVTNKGGVREWIYTRG